MSAPTKEQILAVLDRDDKIGMHAIGRALKHLLDRQTVEEQNTERTLVHNQRGFTGVDGEIGASMAKFYTKTGFLTHKQLAYWRKPCRKSSSTSRIQKYWKQLLEEALVRYAEKNCTVPTGIQATQETLCWFDENVGKRYEDWHINGYQIFVKNTEDAVQAKMTLG